VKVGQVRPSFRHGVPCNHRTRQVSPLRKAKAQSPAPASKWRLPHRNGAVARHRNAIHDAWHLAATLAGADSKIASLIRILLNICPSHARPHSPVEGLGSWNGQ